MIDVCSPQLLTSTNISFRVSALFVGDRYISRLVALNLCLLNSGSLCRRQLEVNIFRVQLRLGKILGIRPGSM